EVAAMGGDDLWGRQAGHDPRAPAARACGQRHDVGAVVADVRPFAEVDLPAARGCSQAIHDLRVDLTGEVDLVRGVDREEAALCGERGRRVGDGDGMQLDAVPAFGGVGVEPVAA